jgi:hypothetical protein
MFTKSRAKGQPGSSGLQPRTFSLVRRLSNAYHEKDVIRIILDVAGHYSIPVSEPGINKKKLVENLNYTPHLLSILVMELDKYVKTIKADASVSDDDVAEAETVGDVTDITEKAVK